jgi:VanZ family protein
MAVFSWLNEQRRGRITRYAPLVIWMAVILGLGFGEASMSETSRFIRPLLKFLFPDAPESTLAFYHGLIRKSAHFVEYGVLAFLAVRAFSASSIRSLKSGRFRFAIALVVLIAASDEFHQSFEPSRTGSPLDILIDVSGGLAILVCYGLLMRWNPGK